MKNSKLTPLTLALALSPTMALAGAELNVATGIDSNPFKLSDSLSPDDAMYLDAILTVKHRAENGLGVKATWQERFYESSESDADSRKLSLGGDIKRKAKLGDKDIDYRAGIKYSDYDKTYVSRITGVLGEASGESLEDRYDWNAWDVQAGVTFELSKKVDLDLLFDYRDRDYDDYQSIGQSNLDYDHWSVKGRVSYSPDKANRLRASYRYREREYDNRLGKDLAGDDVAGTNLEYEYHRVDLSWRHKLDKKQAITLSASYEVREDNVSGYYDQTNKKVQVSYRNTISKQHKVKAKLAYKDYAYDNNDVVASLEGSEPINSKDGYSLEVDYSYRLTDEKKNPWWLIASGSYEDYDSVNQSYVYDRAMLSVGVEKKF